MRSSPTSFSPSTSPVAIRSAVVTPIVRLISRRRYVPAIPPFFRRSDVDAASCDHHPSARRAAPEPCLMLCQFVEPVECGGLVALSQGWVVENGVDEIFHGAAQDHDCLSDVQQL